MEPDTSGDVHSASPSQRRRRRRNGRRRLTSASRYNQQRYRYRNLMIQLPQLQRISTEVTAQQKMLEQQKLTLNHAINQ